MRENEILQRQELHRLRRENQIFNFKREQAIKNDYKAQLIEKLMEKADKANKAKERSKTAAVPSMLNMTMF
jgi:hypothetical protein